MRTFRHVSAARRLMAAARLARRAGPDCSPVAIRRIPFPEEQARGIFSVVVFRSFALRENLCRDEAASQLMSSSVVEVAALSSLHDGYCAEHDDARKSALV